ncbi:MAG: hypothetical protein AABW88_04575 [Nanoarchaeota archaeon]
MTEYFVGNAVFENKDEGPAIISFDGKEYQLYGFGVNIGALATAITSLSIHYTNLHNEVHVEKYRPADITPLNKEESQELRTAIKFEKRANKSEENLEEKVSV